MLKVLENDGTIISGSDGGVINRNLTNLRDGIIHGRYNDFDITYTSDRITIKPGHLIKSGLNVVLDEIETISVTPSSNIIGEYLFVKITANSYGISAELLLSTEYPSSPSLVYTNDVVSGVTAYVLGRLTVGPLGITGFESYKEYLQTYPTLYENVIKISDNTHEGFVEFIIQFTSTMDKTELEGHTIDEFLVENQAYTGFGYVSSGTASDDGPGIFRFEFVTQEGCSKEDYRGGGINFSLQGNENFVVLGSRRIN